MLLSQVMLSYVTIVRPFINSWDNILLIINELAVLIAIFHILVFTNFQDSSDDLKNTVGWSFVALIVLQISANLLIAFLRVAIQGYLAIKRAL